jgi:hypothetical protein
MKKNITFLSSSDNDSLILAVTTFDRQMHGLHSAKTRIISTSCVVVNDAIGSLEKLSLIISYPKQ